MPAEAPIVRMLRGQRVAARRQRELLRIERANPKRAVAEAISAVAALAAQGSWPGPRDSVTERAVERVRRRWVRIGQNAKKARGK